MNVVVTGANTGIGRVTAERLAESGAHVWLACRSRDKTEPIADAINAKKRGKAERRFARLARMSAETASAVAFYFVRRLLGITKLWFGLKPKPNEATKERT